MNENSLKETAAPYRSSEPQSSFTTLADQIYRERVERARRAAPEEKILAGQRLFESACEITLAGIRDQNPLFNEEQCRQVLRERLAWRRRRERTA